MKLALTTVITTVILAVLAVVSGAIVVWVPGAVIMGCMMALAGLLAFGIVGLCVWESLGTR